MSLAGVPGLGTTMPPLSSTVATFTKFLEGCKSVSLLIVPGFETIT